MKNTSVIYISYKIYIYFRLLVSVRFSPGCGFLGREPVKGKYRSLSISLYLFFK